MSIYTIRHGSIAAVQWVTLPDGSEVSVTDAKDGSELRLPRLPLEVQAAINRQFGTIFALPYGMREQFIKDSVPFTVEVPDEVTEETTQC
jgi:hypothetical protein